MKTSTALPQTTFSAISLLLLYLLFCTATSGYCTVESNLQNAPRRLIAAVPADFPPTYFLDKSGKPVGFAVDVMNELARRMGLTVEYVNGQAWDDVIQMVLTGKADLIPSLTIDERRKELLAFTDTVEFLPANLIVASENHTVQGMSPGLTIGVIEGSAPENLLMKNQTIRLTTFNNLQTMLFELLAGKVDGIVTLTPNLMRLAAGAGVDDKIKVVGKPIIEAKRGVALRKGDTELLTHLNKTIGEFIDSSEYRQIYVKWYGNPKPYWTAGRIGAVSGILLVLIVCGMAFWRYRSIVRLNNRLTLSIAEHKQAEKALRNSEKRYRDLSIVDDLTQLYNSRHFYFQLKIELDRSNRYEQPLTLLLLDIDNFKAFNDTYGHVEGDQVLWRLGHVVKRCLRETDFAYRYGGEEFTILLPMTTSEDGAVTAERIRAELKKETFSPEPGQDVHVTVSIGLTQYKPQEEMKVFVHRVDQLMYQGKKNGKDRVCHESY